MHFLLLEHSVFVYLIWITGKNCTVMRVFLVCISNKFVFIRASKSCPRVTYFRPFCTTHPGNTRSKFCFSCYVWKRCRMGPWILSNLLKLYHIFFISYQDHLENEMKVLKTRNCWKRNQKNEWSPYVVKTKYY